MTECYANAAVKELGQLARWNSLTNQDKGSCAASEKYGSRAQELAFAYSTHTVPPSYRMSKAACLRIVESSSWADLVRSGSVKHGHYLGSILVCDGGYANQNGRCGKLPAVKRSLLRLLAD